MIVTLTPNTAIDYTLQVSGFQLNRTIRAGEVAWGMGGKAADASWILGKLGIPTRALGFAAGSNGEGHSTLTSSSLNVSAEHISELAARYEKALEGASCVVMGGSLPKGVPPEFYAQAIAQARARAVPVIFDASGPALAAGMKSRPTLIKPNLAELGDLLGFLPASREEAEQAARRVHEEFDTNVIVTLGAEGAVAVFATGGYFIHPVSVPVVSAAGAGDGVLAGMALAYSRQEPVEYGLQYGFALAAAILGTLATADFRVETYRELLPQISITPL
jgi:1-phosphofructokinase family hexose kinase